MSEECRKYFERVSEYLDGELTPETCLEIEAHLEECPPCKACVESLKKTIALCRRVPCESMPDDVRERLRKTLLDCIGRNEPAG